MTSSCATGQLLLDLSLLKFDELTRIVGQLGDELAATSPSFPGANSPYAILNHCLGMMRYWSSNVNRGIQIPRDRAAEFTVTGPVADLLARAANARAAFIADVLAVDPTAAPAQTPDDREVFWSSTITGVLLHVLEELCQHLGQLEITKDLLTAGEANS
ncbi:hypothetical protein CQ018_18295 [Arthrobacter sp. MYb227]|uniref:mycothiol transferase n=1 Tax=Arthrobacter sp. MYb227 TaxID=1848601 RepID=UPI000CFCC89E|nr:DUF664 domain-containing protein [Arthrobacter sp. MYb227]PQZ86988.1 hypothetical protein CQ018_18295 [Arthrobacter sp. MYb227]